jgi:hypothetical protein
MQLEGYQTDLVRPDITSLFLDHHRLTIQINEISNVLPHCPRGHPFGQEFFITATAFSLLANR